jgi:hypothetical protein
MSVQCPAGCSCWGKPLAGAESRLPCAACPVSLSLCSCLPEEFPVMVTSQQLLANFGLMASPALGMLLLPPCELRLSLRFIQVHLTLCWRKPDWLWHLSTFCLFPPPCLSSLSSFPSLGLLGPWPPIKNSYHGTL